jgi:molybdopterin synthase catalytic subunit
MMIDKILEEIKTSTDPRDLGMILVHNGVVRGTSKDGHPISRMKLSHDQHLLDSLVQEARSRKGILDIRVWINDGDLAIGSDIMVVVVAGRFRKDILPVFEELLTRIKNEVVREEEF